MQEIGENDSCWPCALVGRKGIEYFGWNCSMKEEIRCCIVGPVQWTHSPHSPHVLQTEWRANRLQHATAALQLFRPLIGQCRVNPGFWLAEISPSLFPPPTKDAFVQFQKSSVSNVNIYNISAHSTYWTLKNWKTQKRNQISYLRFKKNNLESKTKRFSYSFLFIPYHVHK